MMLVEAVRSFLSEEGTAAPRGFDVDRADAVPPSWAFCQIRGKASPVSPRLQHA